MPWTHALIVRIRALFRRARVEHELDAELQFHLEQQIEENLAAGMNTEDACASARRSVGRLAHIEDQCRDSLGLRVVDEVKRDVRDACRTLITHPAAALIAALSLALAIGATIAMFTVVDAVLLRPLPYPNPDRIVRVTQPMGAQAFTMFGRAGFQLWPSDLQNSRLFNGMGLYVTGGLNLGGPNAERLRAASVTAGFFEALGAKPTLGRTFTAEDAVVADAEYGDNRTVRQTLHRLRLPYALGISPTLMVFRGTPTLRVDRTQPLPRNRRDGWPDQDPVRVRALSDAVPARA